MQQAVRVAMLLIDLEAALRSHALWDSEAPDPLALASTEPFCVDTLDFAQWLQFVFLPRMRMLIDAGAELPQRCGIAAMAEVCLAASHGGEHVIAVLREIDRAVESAAIDH
jgi:uncharacterized protein YqcC (DUF446 family)